MKDIIGIVWFKDESVYRQALAFFIDSRIMPATYEDWKVLTGRQLEEMRRVGNIAILADFDPETFTRWCDSRGFQADSKARISFAEHAVLEYRKTGKGVVIE